MTKKNLPSRRRRNHPPDPLAKIQRDLARRANKLVGKFIDDLFTRFTTPIPQTPSPPPPSSQSSRRHSPPPPPWSPKGNTYYVILEVTPFASPDVIHAAWKTLSRRYHPDNKETGNEVMAKQVNEAWSVLGDAEKKKKYDYALRNEGVI